MLEPLDEEDYASLAAGDSALPTKQVDEPWPESTYEILGILQAGFSNDPDRLPARLREQAGRLLTDVFWRGLTYDRATVVSVAAVAPQRVFDAIVRGAFKSGSQVLADEAYRQVARLRSLPADLAWEIRRTLLRMSSDGTLRRESLTVRTQLRHFESPEALLRAQRLALIAPRLDVVILIGYLAYMSTLNSFRIGIGGLVLAALIAAGAHVTLSSISAQLGGANAIGGLRSREAAGVSVFFRIYLLLVTLPFAAEPNMVSVGQGLISLAAVLWAPAALLAVRRGQFTHLPAYPLVLLSPLAAAIRISRQVSRSDVLVAIVVASTIGLFVGGSIFIVAEFPAGARNIVFICLGVVCGVASLVLAWVRGRPLCQDALLYRSWSTRRSAALEVAILMDWLSRARSVKTVTRMLVDVQLHELLSADPQTYGFLADLAYAIRVSGTDHEKAFVWRTEDFDGWLKKALFLRIKTSRLSTLRGFEDEIARLIRSLRERPEGSANIGEFVA